MHHVPSGGDLGTLQDSQFWDNKFPQNPGSIACMGLKPLRLVPPPLCHFTLSRLVGQGDAGAGCGSCSSSQVCPACREEVLLLKSLCVCSSRNEDHLLFASVLNLAGLILVPLLSVTDRKLTDSRMQIPCRPEAVNTDTGLHKESAMCAEPRIAAPEGPLGPTAQHLA